MAKTEVNVQYWDNPDVDHSSDTFWVSDAMKSAVGLFWYNHIRGTNLAMPDLSVRLDSNAGKVVVYGFPDDEGDDNGD